MLKLHLGAFDRILPGWMNTDITPHLTVARIPGAAWAMKSTGRMSAARFQQHRAGVFRQLHRLDVTRRFPFADHTVDAIHISHMLSNLTRQGARHCLRECHRVLKAGSILRISTVDLDAAVNGYDPEQPDEFMDLLFDLDTSTRAKNRHWWHYNETSLGAMFRAAGFTEYYRCAFRQGRCPDVEIVDSRPGSLFMEAVK
jgi:SAM-dependent methyltransferase